MILIGVYTQYSTYTCTYGYGSGEYDKVQYRNPSIGLRNDKTKIFRRPGMPTSSPAPSNRSTKSDASPSSRGTGKKKGHGSKKQKPATDVGGASAQEGNDGLSNEAASLLAEAMSSFRVTPRTEEDYAKTKSKVMDQPLPDTIQAPSIVLQHSMKAPADTSGPLELIKYDYLRPKEMAAVWAENSDMNIGDVDLRTPLTDRKGGHDITLENWEQRSKGVAKLVMQNEKAEEEAKERVASFRAALSQRAEGPTPNSALALPAQIAVSA